MTTIRVTPIDGEPIELPEDTRAVGATKPYCLLGRLVGVPSDDGNQTALLFPDGSREPRNISRLQYLCDEYKQAYVHIGDAWPLCRVETWRERAVRLEGELAAMRERWERAEKRAGRCIPEPEFHKGEVAPWVLDQLKGEPE